MALYRIYCSSLVSGDPGRAYNLGAVEVAGMTLRLHNSIRFRGLKQSMSHFAHSKDLVDSEGHVVVRNHSP